MKKFFTLICALVAMAATATAATIDDVLVCKHSYVLVMDEWTNNGTQRPGKGSLFGDGFFLDVTGGSVATNKGISNPGEMITPEDGSDPYLRYGEAFASKYKDYEGNHYNSLRIKNAQDVIAMKVTAGSKLIFLMQGNNKSGTGARIPKIAKDAKLTEALNAAPGADFEAVPAGYKYEWTAADDMTIYIGSYNGDAFIGMIIVEANEAPGTPTVKVGDQKFENGLFYREVTCKANQYDAFGDGSFVCNTIVTYTTDGTMPTAESPVYKEPIKCYKDMTVKFQAFVDYGDGAIADKCEGADNEGIVSLSFDAPTISFDEATKTATVNSAYSDLEGAQIEYYTSYGDVQDKLGQTVELSSSATLTAYIKVINGTNGTYTSKSTSQDIYILDALKEKTTIAVTAGAAVKDEVESAAQGVDVYKIEGGAISADPAQFFVKNLEFGAIPNANAEVAQYQVPAGQEAYIKMNLTNITFKLDYKAAVVVTCSKNACKNIAAETANDRQCKVNVDGTTYGSDDILATYDVTDAEGNVIETLPGNVIKFDLEAGIHTFQKFSGTGNILISSIEITPDAASGVVSAAAAEDAESGKVVKAVKNGSIVIVKGDAEYSVAGAQMK